MTEDTYMQLPYSNSSIESLFKLLHGDRKKIQKIPLATSEELLASANGPSDDAIPQSETISKASHHPIDLVALKATDENQPPDLTESPMCPMRKEAADTKNTTLQNSVAPSPPLRKGKDLSSALTLAFHLFPYQKVSELSPDNSAHSGGKQAQRKLHKDA